MVDVHFLNATLRLKYVTGYDEQNEPIFITKSYRNISPSHNADDLVAVAHVIAGLSSQTLASIVKQETNELS